MSELGRIQIPLPDGMRTRGYPLDVDFQVDTAGVHMHVYDNATGQELQGADIVYNNSDFNEEESKQRLEAFEIVE